MMESEVGEPRRVGGPTRHSVDPMRRGALFLPPFGAVRLLWAHATSCWRPNASWRFPNATWRTRLPSFWGDSDPWARATSCWRPNTTWRAPNATWRTRFALFLGDLDPWISSHVVLEAQRVMAHSQYDVTHSFCSLSGGFGSFGLEPRRVGGPTRHGGLPMRRDALFYPLFGGFGPLELDPRRVGGPTRHGGLPMRRGRAQYNVTRLCLGTSTKKATSELSQRWQA